MQHESEDRDDRRIRVHTHYGALEGLLHTSRGVSTMHYLNVVSSTYDFLTLRPPLACSSDWVFEDGPLAVAMDSILFAVELSEFVPQPGDPPEAARFRRVPIRMRLVDYVVDGFIHVPHGANPISRINQNRHQFIALTVVSVMGPDEQFAASFVAVNRRYITAVQEIATELKAPEEMLTLDRAQSSKPLR